MIDRIKKIIEKIIRENEEEYKKFLSSLIKINSVHSNEKKVADKIEDFLKDTNVTQIDHENIDLKTNRANLYATLNNNHKDPVLIYNGHMDTVGLGKEPWKYDPQHKNWGEVINFKGIKCFYGRGSSDMKAGLAAMVIALTILKILKDEHNVIFTGNLIITTVAAEETSSIGSIQSISNYFKKDLELVTTPKFVVIGEPTSFVKDTKSLTIGEKGTFKMKITTMGTTGHSSNPEKGKNAIMMMYEILKDDNLKQLADNEKITVTPPIPEQDLESHRNSLLNDKQKTMLKGNDKLITKLSCNISAIIGAFELGNLRKVKEIEKKNLNVIPDRCVAYIDVRVLPNQTENKLVKALKDYISGLKYKDNQFVYERDFLIETVSGVNASVYKTTNKNRDNKKEFFNIMENVYKEIYGNKFQVFEYFFPATTDAIQYRKDNFCSETIVFGPGNYNVIHAVDEVCEYQDFIASIIVYTLFACKFLDAKLK